jgi:hypothetical protein
LELKNSRWTDGIVPLVLDDSLQEDDKAGKKTDNNRAFFSPQMNPQKQFLIIIVAKDFRSKNVYF